MDEYADGEVPGTGLGVVTTEAAAPATPTPLTPLAFRYLDQTRPWVRFMSIVTFVAAGLMVVLGSLTLVVALFGGFAGPGAPVAGVFAGGVVGALMSLFYIMGAVLYVVPGVYLARYASALKLLRTGFDAGRLEDALKHQKSFWRFVGIMTVIGLCFMLVVFLFAIVIGIIAGFAAARS